MNIRKTTLLFSLSLALFVGGLSFAGSSHASAAYNGGRIIDNNVFLNANSMNVAQIQSFLASKGSGLASRSFVLQCYGAGSQERQLYTSVGAACDQNMSAAHIIFYASRIYGINPQVIMATLQKEQSLITTGNPTSWQLNQAMGYGCPTTGNCSGNSTFSYQIDSGAWVMRYHYERANGNNNWWSPSSSWVCGTEKNFYKPNLYPRQNVRFYDGNNVLYRTHYIENAATSSFYCYTPHAYNNPQGLYGRPAFGSTGQYYSGSYNFVTSFEQWFGSTQTNTPPYAWSYEGQWAYSDAARTQPFTATPTTTPGGKIYVRVKAKNAGYQIWDRSFMNLGSSRPIDSPDTFADPTWLSNTRPAKMIEASVAPGEIGTFEFTMQSPNALGTYNEYFNVVAEGLSWLNDLGLFFTVNVNNPTPANPGNKATLNSGESITRSNNMLSPDSQSVLSIENDGNLILYSNFKNVWNTGVVGNGSNRLVMQSDGNLVYYTQNNVALWSSQTSGNTGARLVIQTDGNMVVYSSGGAALWASYTNSNPDHLSVVNTILNNSGRMYPGQTIETADRRFRLILQPDGNLVLYSPTRALWASGTDGKSVSFLAMQSDGNLVLYDRSSRPVWFSGTHSVGAMRLSIQQDGNLVLYNNTNQAFWHTSTSGAN